MTTIQKLKNLRTGDLVLHCTEVEVFQKNIGGIKMSGHGAIKINNSGTIYMEFICTQSENVPLSLFDMKLPKDPLSELHKLYLRAESIDGKVYESDGFSLMTNMSSSRPPAHHYIFLSSIHSYTSDIQSMSDDDNYLYFEFKEHCEIPANKFNSITSTLGDESYSWNQAELKMDGYSISLIKNEEYTEVSVIGEFEPKTLLQCLKYYIGFSSASMPQFYYVLRRARGEKEEIISSIYKNHKYHRSSSPMVSNFQNDVHKAPDYHYCLLNNIINLYKMRPMKFECLYSQWERVWHSFQSKNSIMNLTLTVAIEGLLNDIYIPAIKAKRDDTEIDMKIKGVKDKIKNLELTEDERNRILGSVSHWKNITAAKALEHLIEQGIITTEDKNLWRKLRNESAHPKLRDVNLASEILERENVSSCLNLFHKLTLNTLAFSGPIAILQAGKKPKIEVIKHNEILN